MTEPHIVFENEEILLIDKPSGTAVQGGKDVAHPLDRELPKILGYQVYLVHRLDRDTSGLLLLAKSPSYASKWTKIIGGRLVQKEYTAICVGRLPKKQGTIRTSVMQHGDEKSAVTHFRVAAEREYDFDGEKTVLSRVELKLETGRMHQIRIHLAGEGNPIAGDDRHGNFRMNRILRKNLGVRRLLLCASSISLPIDGKNIVKTIELPECMKIV